MSISSPPVFADEDPASPTYEYRMAELFDSPDEEPIPKAPLLANSKPLEFNCNGFRSNSLSQPNEMPFDIPSEFFKDEYLFPDAELGLEDDQVISSLDLDMYLPHQVQNEDILSQAVANAVLPSPEELNNLL